MSIVIVENKIKQRKIELKNLIRGDTFTYAGDLFIVSKVHSEAGCVDCVLLGGLKSGKDLTFMENMKVSEIAIKISFEYI